MLKLLAQLLVLHLQPPDPTKRDAIERLNDRVRTELGKIEAAAQEARREHTTRMADEPVPDRLVRTLRCCAAMSSSSAARRRQPI